MGLLHLGLDVGTTSVSAVLFDSAAAALLAVRSRAHGAGRAGAGPGRAELDLDALWGIAEIVLRDAASATDRRSDIAALGVTGQMHGLALIRPDGAPAAPAITWQDQRATEPDEAGVTDLERFLSAAGGEAAFQPMGSLPAAGYLGPSLYWLMRRGLLPEPPVTACLIPDAMVARLTGKPPITDPTGAASTGLYDVVSGAWHDALVHCVGIPSALLAPVRASGEVAGGLRRAVAESLGLPVGLPVAVSIGDNQASVIGSVRDGARSLLVNVGTGAQVSALVRSPARAPGLEARPFPAGRYLLVGAGLYGGASYALLRDFFLMVGLELGGAMGAEALYERMNELATRAPAGSDGLRFAPLFAGTRLDPAVRGSLTGIGAHNLSPGHLARALLEGIADQLHGLYEIMRPLVGVRTALVGAGNAIAQNALLARIIASRVGLPMHLPALDEAAAVGAALLAATAVGAYPDVDTAMAGALRYGAALEPDPRYGVWR